eukprot:scaffold9449_cov20-Tisochrysis_lutea.AAC.1
MSKYGVKGMPRQRCVKAFHKGIKRTACRPEVTGPHSTNLGGDLLFMWKDRKDLLPILASQASFRTKLYNHFISKHPLLCRSSVTTGAKLWPSIHCSTSLAWEPTPWHSWEQLMMHHVDAHNSNEGRMKESFPTCSEPKRQTRSKWGRSPKINPTQFPPYWCCVGLTLSASFDIVH